MYKIYCCICSKDIPFYAIEYALPGELYNKIDSAVCPFNIPGMCNSQVHTVHPATDKPDQHHFE